jgi:hypothetical protein
MGQKLVSKGTQCCRARDKKRDTKVVCGSESQVRSSGYYMGIENITVVSLRLTLAQL